MFCADVWFACKRSLLSSSLIVTLPVMSWYTCFCNYAQFLHSSRGSLLYFSFETSFSSSLWLEKKAQSWCKGDSSLSFLSSSIIGSCDSIEAAKKFDRDYTGFYYELNTLARRCYIGGFIVGCAKLGKISYTLSSTLEISWPTLWLDCYFLSFTKAWLI